MPGEEWDNVSKPVPFGDEPMEMAAFSADGYEFVTALPAVDGCGEPWGTELFFKKRVIEIRKESAMDNEKPYGGGEPLRRRRGFWLPIPRPSGLHVRLFLTLAVAVAVLSVTWLVRPLCEVAVADWWSPISGWSHSDVVTGYRTFCIVLNAIWGIFIALYWLLSLADLGGESSDGKWYWDRKKDQ